MQKKTTSLRTICRWTVVIAFLLLGPGLHAQQSMRLNNNWEFFRGDLGSIWESVRSIGKRGGDNVPIWDSVSLPHCYNARDAVDPDVNYYQGPAWYRTLLTVDNPYANGRTLLHFEGAGQKTEVYIDRTKVGAHVGGYDEWTVDITDAVAAYISNDSLKKQFKGRIPLSIRTDNSRDPEMIPSSLSDFNIYGGIYRYLNLEYFPALSIGQLWAQGETDSLGREGQVLVRASFLNYSHDSTASVTISLSGPDGKTVRQLHQSLNSFEGDVPLAKLLVKKPRLWSTEDPQTYTLSVTLSTPEGSFTQKQKIGFRSFSFRTKGPFYLNNQRLLIRGTQRHEDHAGLGAAMTEDLTRQELILIKEMGANFIRLGHYQQSRLVLDLCDSLGLLVWEEVPWCRGGLGGPVYQEQARRMLGNMIAQHYNHPSIIIWALGNENDWPGDFPEFDKEKIRGFMKELNGLAHRLDPSRKTAIRRCDFCRDIVDVYSPSIWAGWYRGIYTDYRQITQGEFNKVDHFIHMEWGGDSHAGRNSEKPDQLLLNADSAHAADDTAFFIRAAKVSKDNDWNENYICNLFDWHLKEQETMPWLTGTAQWVFKDFSTPLRPDNPVPYVNQKGVVERDLAKKEGYYVFQSYWSRKPMAHIYGHNWPVRWGDAGERKMVKVYSNCDEAELFVNGKSYGLKKRNSQDFPAAGLRWNAVFSAGQNQLRVIARKGKLKVEDQLFFEYQTEKWGRPAKAEMKKISEANGITTVEVQVYDKDHVRCLDAANWMEFSLAGDGTLLDDLGTSSGSRKVQLYNGRAVIRVKNARGSVVGASVAGLPAAFINLQ